MKMSSIRAIKDGNVVCICQCLFVMKAKSNKLYILFHFNSEKHKCHFAMAKAINFNNLFFFFLKSGLHGVLVVASGLSVSMCGLL